jgi:hypothetical protein
LCLHRFSLYVIQRQSLTSKQKITPNAPPFTQGEWMSLLFLPCHSNQF